VQLITCITCLGALAVVLAVRKRRRFRDSWTRRPVWLADWLPVERARCRFATQPELAQVEQLEW